MHLDVPRLTDDRLRPRACLARVTRLVYHGAIVLALSATALSAASAATLTSPNYQLLVGHPSAAGHGALVLTQTSRLGSTGYALGQLSVVGYSGASVGLQTAASGFWSVVAGEYPSIDVDLDGIASPFDLDDDGDGLLDVVETGRGVFLSLDDTGSSPVDADTDSDGFDDFAEVAGGADPNDPESFPAAAVPLLGSLAMMILIYSIGRVASAQARTGSQIT